jgi:hypothetical protein
MRKFFTKLVVTLGFILVPALLVFSEDITITTYFPTPYGVYSTLHSDQMAIGVGYRLITPPSNGLIVQGNVGIARTNVGSYSGTQTELDVNGEIAANDVWIKNRSVWVSTRSWCTRKNYTTTSGFTRCDSGTTYRWFQRITGSGTYTIPSSGSFLCCTS